MAGYEYNPLLKLDLQKRAAVSPQDIQRIEGEIEAINGDLRNKVPKFFTSIEEIEVGEIGQYQGDSNSTFKNGDFYKRGSGNYLPIFSDPDEVSIIRRGRYVDDDNAGPYLYLLADSLSPESITTPSCLFTFPNPNATNRQIWCFVMPSNLAAQLNITGDIYINAGDLDSSWTRDMEGYLYPYVAIALSNGYYSIQPLKKEGSALYYFDNDTNSWIQIDYSSIDGRGNIQYECVYNANYFLEGKLVPCKYFNTNMGAFVILQNQSNIKQLLWYAAQAYPYESALYYSFSENTDLYTLTWIVEASVIHVGFATLAQGAKADSALQKVVHGTDGLYVETTVSEKNANKEQTISTSLTLQNVETADETHKGVAEAANVRAYFDIIAATSEAYGVMWDTANPSPNCIRIGNMRNHALLPVQSQIVGGVMADDGTFTPFDNQADWTQATQARDGSDGQVMVRIPRHWRRRSQFGTYNIAMLSPVEIPGYVEVREQYVSAYEATLQHSTSKLSSVNNATTDYRGGQNEASWDGTYRSLLNRPITNLNLAEFRTYARNRGNGTKWNCMTYEAVRTIFWLFVTEYATLNSQDEYTSELDVNGFHQGGLGIGVSDWETNAWNNYNGYAPLIPCGVLDEYGSGTAVKNFSIYNANTTLAHIFQCNKYRGIEMPFAHIWKYVDGVLINVASGNGVSTAYTTIEPADFSSTSVANYNAICNTYRVDSYIKGIVFNPDGDIFATQDGANSTSYYCDQYWGANIPSTTELRAWLFGGFASNGAPCGLACALSSYVPGRRFRYLGSRLCFVP